MAVREVPGKKVYVAGDTEIRALKGIDIAFLPMTLPCTMSVENAAELTPKVICSCRYRDSSKADVGQLSRLVGKEGETRVRGRYAGKSRSAQQRGE